MNLTRVIYRAVGMVWLCTAVCASVHAADHQRAEASDLAPPFAIRKDLTYEQARQAFASPDKRFAPFMLQFWDTTPSPEFAVDVAERLVGQGFNAGHIFAASRMPGYLCPPERPCLPQDAYLSAGWFEAMDAVVRSAENHGSYVGFNVDNGWPAGLFHAPRILEQHPDLKAVSLECRKIELDGQAECEVPTCLFAVAARIAEPPETAEEEPPLRTWVWCENRVSARQQVYFRRTLQLDGEQPVRVAKIRLTADNAYTLFVNGHRVGAHDNWQETRTYDVTACLLPGQKNVVAVDATNTGYEAGLILGLRIVFGDGTWLDIGSDSQWRCTEQVDGNDWTGLDFDDSRWPQASMVGPVTSPPWNLGGRLRESVQVHSTSLQVLTTGASVRWRAPEGKWRVYVFTPYHHPGMDHGILNYLDGRLAPIWIEHALQPYAAHFGERLGHGPLQGALLDTEGDYGWHLAWSDHLAVTYQQRTGRDMRLWMPLMFDRDVEGLWARARWDWLDTVSEVYAHEWFKPISDWFQARGMYCSLQVTEGSLLGQAYSVGDFFRAHRACTLPGNDALFSTALRVNDFKEVDSICEFEHRRHLCEIMGVAGWMMTPARLKQCTNAAVAWGTDLFQPHVVYLDRNLRTIPYPPDWYTENPYFTYLHLWTDFVRRASLINASGQLVADTLLYCPMDSVWALSENGLGGVDSFAPQAHAISRVYSEAIEQLTRARIEFLIADNHYLDRSAVNGRELRLAGRAFQSIVLPPLEILPTAVANKLVTYAQAGGAVFVLGTLPQGSTERGMMDPVMAALMTELGRQPSVVRCPGGVKQALAQDHPSLRPRLVFESGEFSVLTRHRRIEGRDFFWLGNNDAAEQACRILLRGVHGEISVWDCETGMITRVDSEQGSDGCRVRLDLGPFQAFWLVVDSRAEPVRSGSGEEESWTVIDVTGPWTVHFDEEAQPDVPLEFRAMHREPALHKLSAAPHSLAPWQAWGLDAFAGLLDYEVTIEYAGHHRHVVLDLGQVRHMAEVWVNGRPVGKRLWAPFRYDVTAALQPGINTLHVRVGNLFGNAMKPWEDRHEVHQGWGYSPSTAEERKSGLLGPVRLRAR